MEKAGYRIPQFTLLSILHNICINKCDNHLQLWEEYNNDTEGIQFKLFNDDN